MQNVLFISKDIFDYRKKISDCLSADLSFKVKTYSIRPETFVYRLIKKLFPSLASLMLEKYHNKILELTESDNFDYVFFTQIHHVPLPVFLRYKAKFHSAQFVLYYWDSLKTHDYSDYINYFTKVFTFDRFDAEHNPKLHYLPLFYSKDYRSVRYQETQVYKYDLLFVGSINNLSRYYQLKLFIEWAKKNNLRFYHHAVIALPRYARLIFRDRTFPPLRFFYLKPYQVQNLFMTSKVILDLPNNIQSGLTLRTIETIGAGKKLITMNESIYNEVFYDEQRIFIAKESFPPKEFFDNCENIDYKGFETYSLENWLRTIFGLNG